MISFIPPILIIPFQPVCRYIPVYFSIQSGFRNFLIGYINTFHINKRLSDWATRDPCSTKTSDNTLNAINTEFDGVINESNKTRNS